MTARASPLRILMVHAYYQQRGGEDASFEVESNLLRENGHHVVTYTAQNADFAERSLSAQAMGTVWNHEAYRDIKALVDEHRPDVVHFQNTFPAISPAGYWAARTRSAVVESIRNYRPVCVNALLFREGSVCEECVGRRIPVPGIRYGCYRGSRSASGVVAGMIGFHRLIRTWSRAVDRYVVLNREATRALSTTIPAEKMRLCPNLIWPEPPAGSGGGGYALFAGRLSPEKGIGTLIRSWSEHDIGLPLVIAGDGVLEQQVKEASSRNPAIDYAGRLPSAQVADLMGNATCLVFPSEWYEGFPRVILEAFARGTPVAAADIGSAGELVIEGKTGSLFQPGDPIGLAAAVRLVVEGGTALRGAVRSTFQKHYSAQAGYSALVDVYREAIDARWQPRPRDLAT